MKEPSLEGSLRPEDFEQFIGQRRVVESLKTFIEAAKKRNEPLDHVLLYGPPGLGKTTLASLVAKHMGVGFHRTSGPAIRHKGALASMLTRLAPGDVLFIDEIHRLPKDLQEELYPAMEDFRLDVVVGEGSRARAMGIPVARFTLIGATTRTGLLSKPLRDRFLIVQRLHYYEPAELADIVMNSGIRLGIEITRDGALEIGRRSRGTPRIAIALLRRVRDVAQVTGTPVVDGRVASQALNRLDIDGEGLTRMDRMLLRTVIEQFAGGPVGIEAIASLLGEERDTIENEYEPFLLQQGYLSRTRRGRIATSKAYQHLGLEPQD